MKKHASTLNRISFGFALCLAPVGCAGEDGGADSGMSTTSAVTGDPTGSPTGDPTGSPTGTTGATTDSSATATSATTDPTDTGGGPRPMCDTPATGTLSQLNVTTTADLDALAGIGTITGSIWIHGSDVANLDAMICVTSIGDELNIYDNDLLTSVAGLDNIETVGGVVVVSDNDLLTAFDTLGKVAEVDSWTMNDNGSLLSVTGPTSLEVITKHLVIQYNDVLNNISGLTSLQAIGGSLQVTNNPELCESQINNIGAGLAQGPNLDGSSTASNKGC